MAHALFYLLKEITRKQTNNEGFFFSLRKQIPVSLLELTPSRPKIFAQLINWYV